jgi:hypothetical protein
MKIDQDTYKNDVLHFGAYGSEQRDRLYEWRWQQFIDVLTDKYPEYFLKFYSHREVRKFHLSNLHKVMNFRMKDKLKLGLTYPDMESVNSAEFKKVMIKLRNYIKQGGDVESQLRQALIQPLPHYYHQFQ